MKCYKWNISYLLGICFIGGLFFIKEVFLMKIEYATIWLLFLILLPIVGVMTKSFHYRLIVAVLLFLFWAYMFVSMFVGNYEAKLLGENFVSILLLFTPLCSVSVYIYKLLKKDFFEV